MNTCVVNFRDVGATINLLSGQNLMVEQVLYRGGKIEGVESLESICFPKTIVNLRKGIDPEYLDAVSLYSPAPDSVEVYDMSQGRNKK